MIANFYITGSGQPRPSSRRTIFCDGSADASFRPGVDLELSHWTPNRTPPRYKADTSTDICMSFVVQTEDEKTEAPAEAEKDGRAEEQTEDQEWDLAINNHLDVDGLLSVYTLTHSQVALSENLTIVKAAEMGDFWGWGERSAQWLFQGLTLLMNELSDRGTDVLHIYKECFSAIPSFLSETHPLGPAIEEGLAHLQASVELVESRMIARYVHGDRFVQYTIPAAVAAGRLEQALYVPAFNECLSDKCLLWPQARARWDAEKVCLVSIEQSNGWYHDLWYPGYMWADTLCRWRAPGVTLGSERFDYEPLDVVIGDVQSLERNDGQWVIMRDFAAFDTNSARDFPVIASFLSQEGQSTPSSVSPEIAGFVLSQAFR